jgi:hypothetical protein
MILNETYSKIHIGTEESPRKSSWFGIKLGTLAIGLGR